MKQKNIEIIGSIKLKELNVLTKKLEVVNPFSYNNNNIILDNGLGNFLGFLNAETSYPVHHLQIGQGGRGDDIDKLNGSRSALLTPVPGDGVGIVPIDSYSVVQNFMTVVFNFRLNIGNNLYNYLMPLGSTKINEMGLFLSNNSLMTYKSFPDPHSGPGRTFSIKYNIISIVEYELKIRRYTLTSASSASSESSTAS
jgi:hypothetical protein